MLTPAQTQKAIEYNKNRGYTPTEIQMIQKTVGTKADGVWGPRSVGAVYEWQGFRLLTQDGMVGPKTFESIRQEAVDEDYRPPPVNCKPKHGIWLDGPKKHFLSREACEEMAEHGITSLAVMVETSNPKFDPKLKFDELAQLCEWAEEFDQDVGLTDWPFPTIEWMEKAEQILTPWYEQLPLMYTESDLEGNWVPRLVDGFDNLDLAGDHLVAFKDRLCQAAFKVGCRFESTTFTSHTENGRAADVAPHTDGVFGQAYSVRNRNKKNPETGKWDVPWQVAWGHTYGPGNMVKHTLDRSLQIVGVPETVQLGCGLAAYDQVWPGRSAQEAMRISYDAALLFNPFEVRWWSYKWVFGHLDTDYGRPFLRSIAA